MENNKPLIYHDDYIPESLCISVARVEQLVTLMLIRIEPLNDDNGDADFKDTLLLVWDLATTPAEGIFICNFVHQVFRL